MSSPPLGPTGPRGGHQHWRHQLGAFALGHLDDVETAAVRAHLDGCASCRAELAEIAPLAALLDTVDVERFAAPPAPTPDLGGRIRDAVASERSLAADRRVEDERAAGAADADLARAAARRRRTTRIGLLASAAALVVLALGGGWLLGRSDAPEETAAPRPYEAIELRDVGSSDLRVDRAGVVPHTWGVELEFQGAGFIAGQTYRASFRTTGTDDDDGLDDRMVSAGEFRGVGGAELVCHLQSSVMRDDVDRVVVTDARGRRVLVAEL